VSATATVRSAAGRPLTAYLNPVHMVQNLWTHRHVTGQLAWREIMGRYRAARLGLLWSILTPLLMLVVYTFVFSVIFQSRWNPAADESKARFALTLFCGLLVWTVFAEVVARAPMLVVFNPNYVKKVIFPLEVLTVATLGGALFNLLVGLGVWAVGLAVFEWRLPPVTLLYFPAVLAPVCLLTLGVTWVLASLGVFIRDIGPAVQVALQLLFFGTPIFYRIEVVPEPYRSIMYLNPLTQAVEAARRVMMLGQPPEWAGWVLSLAASAAAALLGYAFFMKSKRAFADVL